MMGNKKSIKTIFYSQLSIIEGKIKKKLLWPYYKASVAGAVASAVACFITFPIIQFFNIWNNRLIMFFIVSFTVVIIVIVYYFVWRFLKPHIQELLDKEQQLKEKEKVW